LTPRADLTRRTALAWLAVATALGAAFRFYNLAWGAPYFHFHIDEHFVLGPANLLRHDAAKAAMSAKFFMYSPLEMYALNIVRDVYELFAHPLELTVPHDEVTYMVLGRAISASLGTATIPLTYLVAERVGGRLAGVLSAFLLACTVIHLRDSHFFALDVSVTFFCVLAWHFLMRIVDRGTPGSTAAAGFSFGFGVLSKYTAAFIAPLIALAELLSPDGPLVGPAKAGHYRDLGKWARAAVRATVAIGIGVGTFLLLDPLVIRYYAKFRSDIKDWVTDPLLGINRPIWIAQFTDVNPQTYWLTNLLWWSVGPALEIWAIVGLAWLFVRRDRIAFMAAAFPIVYWLFSGRTIAPFVRYVIPLTPGLAVAAGVVSADWIRRPRWRTPAIAATVVVVGTTFLWALAYMNVFRAPDSRLAASEWLVKNVPPGSTILVEPSQNTPPMGSYLNATDFNGDYVLWADRTGQGEREDYYHLYTLDVYRFLYNPGVSDETRQRYIDSRLRLADWIVMDDTFVDFYSHLSEQTHHIPKQYYRDLFAGKLGFDLAQSFKTYPALFGRTINDDNSELTFRLFDHPRVFIFRRR
jgi:hypothetical protein